MSPHARELRTLDWVLIATLLPLYLVTQAAQVYEGMARGLTSPRRRMSRRIRPDDFPSRRSSTTAPNSQARGWRSEIGSSRSRVSLSPAQLGSSFGGWRFRGPPPPGRHVWSLAATSAWRRPFSASPIRTGGRAFRPRWPSCWLRSSSCCALPLGRSRAASSSARSRFACGGRSRSAHSISRPRAERRSQPLCSSPRSRSDWQRLSRLGLHVVGSPVAPVDARSALARRARLVRIDLRLPLAPDADSEDPGRPGRRWLCSHSPRAGRADSLLRSRGRARTPPAPLGLYGWYLAWSPIVIIGAQLGGAPPSLDDHQCRVVAGPAGHSDRGVRLSLPRHRSADQRDDLSHDPRRDPARASAALIPEVAEAASRSSGARRGGQVDALARLRGGRRAGRTVGCGRGSTGVSSRERVSVEEGLAKLIVELAHCRSARS